MKNLKNILVKNWKRFSDKKLCSELLQIVPIVLAWNIIDA